MPGTVPNALHVQMHLIFSTDLWSRYSIILILYKQINVEVKLAQKSNSVDYNTGNLTPELCFDLIILPQILVFVWIHLYGDPSICFYKNRFKEKGEQIQDSFNDNKHTSIKIWFIPA